MRVTKIVSFSVVILLITVVFAGAVPAAAQTDTMQFHYNAQHTGDYSSVAGPVPSNGQLKWTYTTEGGVQSSPAVVNGVVYVGSTDGNVYALNASNGSKLWNYPTGVGLYSCPAVVNGVVYVMSMGVWNESTNLVNSTLYALNASNGTKLWNYTTYAETSTYSSPTVVNGVVYVASNYPGVVYALNAATGHKLWNYTTESYMYWTTAPAVANGVVYVGTYNPGSFYALNAKNGSKLWNYPTGSVSSAPAVANGVVYVGSATGTFYALNANNGTELWNYQITRPSGSVIDASPAVANGVVYIGSQNGYLYALNANNGTELWNNSVGYWTNTGIESSPAVANGVVYVGCDNYNLYALNANNGTELWNYTTGSYVESSPAVVKGVVYVGSSDGNVYAIGNSTTMLNATAPATALVNQKFTINGTLSGSTFGIAGATITLQRSTNNVTFTNVTTKKTNTTGGYTFSRNESAAHVYYYRTTYAGNASYTNATSNVVKVTVKIPTALTATAPATGTINTAFVVKGTLTVNTTTNHTGIGSQTVTLIKYNATSKHYDITLATTTTNATAGSLGAYTFSVTETPAGTYHYELKYGGNATYTSAYAATSVKVA